MGTPMKDIVINLDCGHEHVMPEWDRGDRRVTCSRCGRIWLLTATKVRTIGIQTKTEIKNPEPEDDLG